MSQGLVNFRRINHTKTTMNQGYQIKIMKKHKITKVEYPEYQRGNKNHL